MNYSRQYTRYPITGNGHLADSSLQDHSFIVNNISANGINITTDIELPTENAVTMCFDMPQVLLPNVKELKGTVVRKGASSNGYDYGIHFTEMSKVEVAELDEYLRFKHFDRLVNMVGNPDASTMKSTPTN